MKLVQLLLPAKGSRKEFERTCEELTEKFGGLTSYSRGPAKGFWKPGRETKKDEIVVLEVMVSALRIRWWATYERTLERRFKQKEIVIRSLTMRKL